MVSSLSARRLAALLGLSALWLSLLCTPALAHARLIQTDPADGERLSWPPEQVQLRFNEPIEAAFTPVKVFGPQGGRIDRDNARVAPDDARVLVVDLKDLSEGHPTGVYTVEWRVTSADGHPVNGSYEFTVTDPGPGELQSNAQAGAGESKEQPSDQEQDTGGAFAHIIHIVGLGLGVVAIVVLALLRRTGGKSSS